MRSSRFRGVVALLSVGVMLVVGLPLEAVAQTPYVPVPFPQTMTAIAPTYWWRLDGGSGVPTAGSVAMAGGTAVASPLGGGSAVATGVGVAGLSSGDVVRSKESTAQVWMRFPSGSYADGHVVGLAGWTLTLNGDGRGAGLSVANTYGVGSTGWVFPYSVRDGRWHQVVVYTDDGNVAWVDPEAQSSKAA